MFKRLLIKIAQTLDKAGIGYMVIGGQAVLLHGEPRLTKDIDITLGVDATHLPSILTLVDKLKFEILTKNPSDFVKDTMVLPLIDQSSGVRIDFIFSSSEYEKAAIDRAKEVDIDGGMVKFASVEDLIIHKIIAGRSRDIEDFRSIRGKNPDFDRQYIEGWLTRFDNAMDTSYIQVFRDECN